eukprot:Gb_10751 [translate_table: standard]
MQAAARRAAHRCQLSSGSASLGFRYAYGDLRIQRASFGCRLENAQIASSPTVTSIENCRKRTQGGSFASGITATALARKEFLGCNVVQQLGKVGSQVVTGFRCKEKLQRESNLMDDLGQRRNYGSMESDKTDDNHDEGNKETISVTFVDKDGEEKVVQVPIGMSMLEAAHQNDIELEGACEGSLACSTCHVIVMDENYYNKLQEPTDEENDMLDLAFGLTET